MVQGQEQQVRAGGDPRQLGPDHRRTGEVERPAGLGGGEPQALLPGERTGQARQIDHRHRQRTGRQNGRDRLAVWRLDPRAQDLVAARHLGQPRAEGADVERPVEPEGHQHVGVRALRVHLLGQPHALLAGREEDRRAPVAPGNAGLDRCERGFPLTHPLGEERPFSPRELLQLFQ